MHADGISALGFRLSQHRPEYTKELNPTEAAALLRPEQVIRPIALRHLLSFLQPSAQGLDFIQERLSLMPA